MNEKTMNPLFHPSEHRICWTYCSSLTLWNVALYPLLGIQSRTVCAPWLRPIGSHVELWLPDRLRHHGKKYYQPLLTVTSDTPSCIFSTNIITNTYSSLQCVIRHEGILGLYKGFFPFILHSSLRDVFTYYSLRFLYCPFTQLFTQCKQFISRVLGIQSSLSSINDTHTCSPDTHQAIIRSALSPTDDIPQLMIKVWIELLCYPLLVIQTKCLVYEGPEPMNTWEMFDLSNIFEGGITHMYNGITPYILLKLMEYITDISCIRVCRYYRIPSSKIMTIRTGISTVISTLITPLSSLSLIQRAQSELPGLCTPTATTRIILQQMPWKILTINFILTSVMSLCNTAIFLSADTQEPSLPVSPPSYCIPE